MGFSKNPLLSRKTEDGGDIRHLENREIAISQWKIIRF